MNTITLFQPSRIVFGDGCASRCAEFLAQRGCKRVLLVVGAAVIPLIEGIIDNLKRSGLTVITAPTINREPTISDFKSICQVALMEKVDSVLGTGGRSVIDVAKLVAALAK